MLLGCLEQFLRLPLRNCLFKLEERKALVRCAYWLMFSTCLFFCGSASAGLVYFSGNIYQAVENQTTLTVTVNRIGPSVASASVNVVSADLTATSPADFTAVSESLTWGIGDESSKSFTVSITDDLLEEGTERFLLKFLTPVGDVAGGDVTVIITDHEEGKLQLSSAYFSGKENSLQIIARINRVSGTNGSASVRIKSSDGVPIASDTFDYTAIDTTVSFADGESTKNVSITLKNDDIAEFSEWFKLTLSDPNNASLGAIITANAEIKDSDINFTGGLKLLSKDVTNLNIEKQQLLDLTQASLLDTKKTMLDLVNAIPIFLLTDVTVEQATSGLLTIDIGTDRLYFRPVAVKKAAAGEPPNIRIQDGGSVEFLTSQGWFLEAQPVLSNEGISIFQKTLADAFLPKLVITEYGNMTIQKDQGAAPYELDNLKNVIVNYSFYDRWNFRSSMLSSVTNEKKEGISLTKHPADDEEYEVSVIYSDGNLYRQQILSSAPVNGQGLIQQLRDNGIQRCAAVNAAICREPITINVINPKVTRGILTFDTSYVSSGSEQGLRVTLFADYEIRKVPKFVSTMVGFTETTDQNKDTLNDYKMIYANGEEQYFFLVSAYVLSPLICRYTTCSPN